MMTSAAKIGGRILIADIFNHEKISWNPLPPSSMLELLQLLYFEMACGSRYG